MIPVGYLGCLYELQRTVMYPLHLPELLNIMHSCHSACLISMRTNHVNYVGHDMCAFTKENSRLMKFFKSVKRMKEMHSNERNLFLNS